MILEKTCHYQLELLYQQEEELNFSFVMNVTSRQSACPKCGALSHKRHSRYSRKLLDLPLDDKTVIVLLLSNK